MNKTNFHMKGFSLGLTLKQRQNATRKSAIVMSLIRFLTSAYIAENETEFHGKIFYLSMGYWDSATPC